MSTYKYVINVNIRKKKVVKFNSIHYGFKRFFYSFKISFSFFPADKLLRIHPTTPGSWPVPLQLISARRSPSSGSILGFRALVKDTWEHSSVSALVFSHKVFWQASSGKISSTLPPGSQTISRWFGVNGLTWQALSSGARLVCRAFCSAPDKARRPDGRRTLPSSRGRSPWGQGSAPGGRPGSRWRCGVPSFHWVWCTWDVTQGVTRGARD